MSQNKVYFMWKTHLSLITFDISASCACLPKVKFSEKNHFETEKTFSPISMHIILTEWFTF